MNVKHIYTKSEYLSQLPIVNGQLIVLKDKDAMYYDIDDKRHAVTSGSSTSLGDLVTIPDKQTITGEKTFTTLVNLSNVAQGEGTTAEGTKSAAFGKDSYAEGDYSVATGVSTKTQGKGSFASGAGTNTTVDYSAAVGLGNNPIGEDLFEVGNGTVLDSEGNILPEDARSLSNAFRVTSDGRAIAEKDVETESGIKLSDREATANKVTAITDSATDTQYPSALAVKKLVDNINEVIADLPEPMLYKGTLGTGGSITSLPTASSANTGFTYKVITAGTYDSQSAKVGDVFISRGTAWDLIPSGDEPSGTVTNVAAQGSNGIQVSGGPITTSGTLQISGVLATQTSNGMMSAADKKKLDNLSSALVLTDDTAGKQYTLGVNNGIFYIKEVTA